MIGCVRAVPEPLAAMRHLPLELQQGEQAVIRVVGIPNDSPGLGKGGEGRHRTLERIVSDVSPEKRSICVSSSVALAGLSHTITEEPVSCDSAGETPRGLAG